MKKRLVQFKYNIHLAGPSVSNFNDFLTDNAKNDGQIVQARGKFAFNSLFLIKESFAGIPSWAQRLDHFFEINGRIKSSSGSAVLLFECEGHILACTYGHGHTFIDTDKRVNDFGLRIAVNSLSADNVKLVEKANLGTSLRDFTQAAGITRLQDFDVNRALNLVRKVTGKQKDKRSSISGASSITIMSELDLNDLEKLGKNLLELYNSKEYLKTPFAVIDKIKPIVDPETSVDLDMKMLSKLNDGSGSFELGVPEINTTPIGYVKVSGFGCRTKFHDISLKQYLELANSPITLLDLHKHKIDNYDIDELRKLQGWSIYKGLVGSIDIGNMRYAINEGNWYAIDQALKASANQAFTNSFVGLDAEFPVWGIEQKGDEDKIFTTQTELNYNKSVVSGNPERFLLFDQKMFMIPNESQNKIEICDIFDFHEKKLIHVKRSGRRSSIISHFLNQGLVSARNLKMYPEIQNNFFEALSENNLNEDTIKELKATFPREWIVEYKFGDIPNPSGKYMIPFFSRIALESVKREIMAMEFKAVEISFIKMSTHKYS
jgi:uncharacterized protein (TIGR04141 family)